MVWCIGWRERVIHWYSSIYTWWYSIMDFQSLEFQVSRALRSKCWGWFLSQRGMHLWLWLGISKLLFWWNWETWFEWIGRLLFHSLSESTVLNLGRYAGISTEIPLFYSKRYDKCKILPDIVLNRYRPIYRHVTDISADIQDENIWYIIM